MALRAYAGLVRKYGALDFSKIVAERILRRLTGGALSAVFFRRAMKSGVVYFGEHLGARQGVMRRHFYMYSLACQEIARDRSHRFQVLEVGSYAGASAITWALAIRERHDRPGLVICVDPWRNYLSEEDIAGSATPDVLRDMAAALEDGKVFALFEHNVRAAHLSDIISPLKGRFSEVASSVSPESCDIVYVDANHGYSAVLSDLHLAAGLTRPGGVLCGDDLEAQWPDLDRDYCESRVMRDLVVDPKSGEFVHPGVSKAVWDFFGAKVSSWNGFWAMRKTVDGSWAPVTLPAAFSRSQIPIHLKWWKTKAQAGLLVRPRAKVELSSNG
ncbi:MAG TPA: class I SAM-dependent methyltransferase [Terriglobia bacterium]|nr:class I SAM-dependent methyltransferase [Terriglobia bacterium]